MASPFEVSGYRISSSRWTGGRRQSARWTSWSLNRNTPVLAAGRSSGRRRAATFSFSSTSPSRLRTRSRARATRRSGSSRAGCHPDDFAAVATVSAESGLSLDLTFTVGPPADLPRRSSRVGPSRRRSTACAIRSRSRSRTPGDPRLVVQEAYTPKHAHRGRATPRRRSSRRSDSAWPTTTCVTRVVRHLSDMSNLASRSRPRRRAARRCSTSPRASTAGSSSGAIAHEKSTEQTAADNDAMLSGAAWSIDVDRRYANAPMRKQLADTAELLRRSDCVVYPIDIAGIRKLRRRDHRSVGRGARISSSRSPTGRGASSSRTATISSSRSRGSRRRRA